MGREPERSCVGCRKRAPKVDLLRIVRSEEGPRVDLVGSASGRGAYVHRDPGCADAAVRRGAVASALRSGLTQEELARLRNEIEEASQAT
ncbi:MAG TPA: YlxR family protein [Actinomycetota bacterium]|nr:YlxR family protein [Actinomycetota bacterium]